MDKTVFINELLSDRFRDLRDKYGLPFVYDKARKEVVGINQHPPPVGGSPTSPTGIWSPIS